MLRIKNKWRIGYEKADTKMEPSGHVKCGLVAIFG